MAEDLLERILREVRERKEAARAAYDESVRLQAALDALDGVSGRGGGGAEPAAAEPAGPTAPRVPRGENRRRILEVVEERPGVSAAEVAQATGIAKPTVASTLSKLARDGVVEQEQLPAGGVGYKRRRAHESAFPAPSGDEGAGAADASSDGTEDDASPQDDAG